MDVLLGRRTRRDQEVEVPAEIFDAAVLTRYAAVTRYPGHTRPVTDEDHHEAVELARGHALDRVRV